MRRLIGRGKNDPIAARVRAPIRMALIVLLLTSLPFAPSAGALTRAHAPSLIGATRAKRVTAHEVPVASEVQAALGVIWPEFVNDLIHKSPAWKKLATPSAAQVVTGYVQCLCVEISGTWKSDEITAPAQTTYPMQALVEMNNFTTNVVKGKITPLAFDTFVVLQQASAGSPWMIAYIAGNKAAPPILNATSSSSLSTVPQPTATFAYTFNQLVDAMISARNHGTISSKNMWDNVNGQVSLGYQMQGLEEDYWTQAGTVKYEKQKHLPEEREVGSYSLGAESKVFTVKGGTLLCAYVEGSATYSGQEFLQTKKNPSWGPLLAPGEYSSLLYLSTRDACIMRQSSGHDIFIGILGGTWKQTGVPFGTSAD
jgi:hypothetical protein